MKRVSILLPGLLLALTAAQARADGDRIPTADAAGIVQVAQDSTGDWIEALKTPVKPESTRGLSVVPGVLVRVQFAFGSARLTDRSKTTLNELGRALVSEQLSPYRFRIDGHTDAVGEAAFNLGLSEQRALAVQNYLSANFEIGAGRLESAGLGEGVLLVEDDPAAGENRRVEIKNIGAGG